MSEDIKDDSVDENVTSLDKARIDRMQKHGHYYTMLEKFEILRLKFIYDTLDKEEAIAFVTLCKYFRDHGTSETMRLSAHYIFEKYIKGKDL